MTKRFQYDVRFPNDVLDNGTLIHGKSVVDLLNEQHETIQSLTNDKKELQEYMARRDNKVQETLQKHYNKCDTIGQYTIKDIAEELGVELK